MFDEVIWLFQLISGPQQPPRLHAAAKHHVPRDAARKPRAHQGVGTAEAGVHAVVHEERRRIRRHLALIWARDYDVARM